MLRPHFLPGFTRRSLLIGSLTIFFLLVTVLLAAYRIFFYGKNKAVKQSSQETKVTEVSNRFTYDPQKRLGIGSLSNYNPNEPAFSLKLPDGWILRKPDSPVNRLSTISAGVDQNGREERAVLGVNIITPRAGTLVEAVKAEKEEILRVGEDRYFFTDKETRLNGQAAYFLEYKIKLSGTEPEQQWDHHVDVFFVRNGYLIDLYASTQEKDWGIFVETIEKSVNTFRLLTS